IGVVVLRPALGRAAIAPTAYGFFIDPQREAASSNQRGVIRGPVTDAVGRLLFHAGDVPALPIHATTPPDAESKRTVRVAKSPLKGGDFVPPAAHGGSL